MHHRTPMMEAARVVATLVPNLVDEVNDDILWHTFDRVRYDSLSSGEQAAYDLARELWTSGGTLPRFLSYIDIQRAEVLLSAVHVALSQVWFPVGTRRARR
jgi:hypothetical protein